MAVLLQGGGHKTDTGLTPHARPISSPVLVGRDKELSRLVEVAQARPGLALVEGEAGIGKTRLVTELSQRPELRGLRPLRGRCHPLREPFPLGAIVEALRSAGDLTAVAALSPAAGTLRLLLPELSDRLPPSPNPTGDLLSDRHLLFQGLIETLSRMGPTLCVLEDLHWGDDQTWDFLHFLVSQLPRNLALVVTCRRDGVLATSPFGQLLSGAARQVTTTRVTLNPLTAIEVGRLVSELVPEGVSEDLIDVLHERTSGIPFAVEEVVRLIHDRGDVLQGTAPLVRRALEHLEVPASIRDSVVGRVSQLRADARRVVDAAAILDSPATEAQLVEVAGLNKIRGAAGLSEAARRVALVEYGDGRFGFRHALAGQAVREAIPEPERRRYHERSALLLARLTPPPLAQLSRHNREAGRLGDWLHYAEEAAVQAWSQRDPETATYYLREALSVPDLPLGKVGHLAIAMAHTASECSRSQTEAIALLRRIIDEGRVSRRACGLVRTTLASDVSAQGASDTPQLQRAVAELSPWPRYRAMPMLGLARIGNRHISERLNLLARAAADADPIDAPNLTLAVAETRATILVGICDARAPELVDALPWDLALTGDDSSVSMTMMGAAHNIGRSLFVIGDYESLRRLQDWAATLAEMVGWGKWLSAHKAQSVLLDYVTGDWNGLEDRARQLKVANPGTFTDQVGGLVTGLLRLACGDLRGAEVALGEADSAAASMDSTAIARSCLGRVHLERGRPAEAADEVLPVLDAIVVQSGVSAWVGEALPVAVEALLACDRAVEAESMVSHVAKDLDGLGAPLAQASLSLSRGLLIQAHDRESAVAHYGHAARQYAALPRPYEAARATERHGSCLAAISQPGASGCLVEALKVYRRLGAAGDVSRVRRILRAHRFPVPRVEGRRISRGMTLSVQEREVVRHAANGLTASEIGTEFSLSRRTVEKYLLLSIRKLGLDHKRDLVGHADLARTAAAPDADGKKRS